MDNDTAPQKTNLQVPLELVTEKLTAKLAMAHQTIAILEAANDVLQGQVAHLQSLLPGNEPPLLHSHGNGDAPHAHG